jgi:hypothetical protein
MTDLLKDHFPARGSKAATDWKPIVRYRALSNRVIAAAQTRIEGRWAAYIDAVPGRRHREEFEDVLHRGAKLDEKIARVIFWEFDEVPYAE